MQSSSIRTFINNHPSIAYTVSSTLLLITIVHAITSGTLPLTYSQVIEVIYYSVIGRVEEIDPVHENIIMLIRLPRVLLALFVGGSLAIAGASFQGLLQNPLADPYTLGISSGASLGAVIVMFFGISIPLVKGFTLPIVSIMFGFITLVLVLGFTRLIDKKLSIETIILSGIIFSAFIGSFISLIIALTGEELRQIITWLLGSVSMRGWAYVQMITPFTIIGVLILQFNAKELNAMAFGEDAARHIGVDVERRKFAVLCGASLLAGSAVAVSGTIGFVGLVIPHITRILWGVNHRHLLPLSFLNGSTFLILADTVARTIISPSELPIGVITALIGAPVFAILFYMTRRTRAF
ncbi:FecCD family ABC transporter permease [Bacillus solimangrovi]|uniref:ABC transporter permease n=1 Tax=Bacillus solimangrovi TaxID=1305675 RepID=A0A1E5LHH2_9BACI|nr:iron ABC transporter permease [Bacillus solimangrovi]OEH93521.1 ABC transporter permease [Bacillus solimangrovi]